ncbi:hypothetical protein M758_9G142500 [Ceratodon purpureus]|nr:hypothetical protein M758_9G142500 [Ceratodon purpureus]
MESHCGVLSSVLATNLAISLIGSAFTASDPGGDGAERTARKADELLQGADSLIKPTRPSSSARSKGSATEQTRLMRTASPKSEAF